MKIRIFKLAFFLFFILAVLTSCNNDTIDVTPQFLRGGNSLVLSENGNLVIAGYNTSSTTGYDAVLMMRKTDGDTATAWTKSFGGSYSDAFYSVKNSNEGGFIAAGFTNNASVGSPAVYVVITDENGKSKKTITYRYASASQGFSVISANSDSGYLVAGVVQKTSNSDRDIYLVRIKEYGDTLWTKSLGAKSTSQYDMVNDAAYSVIAAPAPDSGYYVTGSLNGYSQSGGQIFLMKVSAKGDSLWTKTYGTGIGFSLTLTKDNGIAISGSLQEGSSQDIFLLKTNLDGEALWSYFYGGSGFEYGANMIETSDGGFAIAGITDSKGFGNQDVCLILTNSLGVGSWDQAKTYGKTDNDQGFGLVEMPDKGFCITGLSNSGGSYVFLNRVQSDGTPGTVGWERYIE
ncbi:MAG: hypothetical protein Q7U54_10740 [Bacteroidales bacterium]|nr:hypothetical protein [Bacteroidales bacterium]